MAYQDVYGEVLSTSVVAAYYDEVSNIYKGVLKKLLPPGPAWDLKPDGNFENLLQAMGYSFERVLLRAVDLGHEFSPSTMFELLEDWERVFGLPGTNPSPPTSLASRREAVAAKMLGHGDPSIPVFEAIASAAGYETVFASKAQGILDPFVPGSPVGDFIWNNTVGGWAFVWLAISETGSEDDLVQWLLEGVSPDHTLGIFTFLSSAVLDDPFNTWTGDDPDNWVVSETGSPAGVVQQVGSGEDSSGTGTGSVNFSSTNPSATATIYRTTGLTLSVGEWYVVVLDISYASGPGVFLVQETGSFWYEYDIADLLPGQLMVLFQATATPAAILFGLDTTGSSSTVGEVTVDRARILGPVNL